MAILKSNPTKLSVTPATSPSPDADKAEADWVTRSTAPGVIWAHDFRNDAEYSQFMRGQSNPFVSVLGATPFGKSRAIRSRGIGTTFTLNAPGVGSRFTEQTWSLRDVSKFPNPATMGPFNLYVGAPDGVNGDQIREMVRVVSINYSTNQMTVIRGQEGSGSNYWTLNYRAGVDTVGLGPQGQWRRPFAAFPAGQNGLTVADRGITTGLVLPRSWAGFGDVANNWAYREGYYAHSSYHTGGIYDGDEFYIQFRVKIHGSRFKRTNGSASKLWYLQKVEGTVSQQFYGSIRSASSYDAGRWPPPPGWPYQADATAGGTAIRVTQDQSGIVVADPYYQKGGQHGATCISEGGTCLLYAPNEWVTFMIHCRPGRNGVAESVWELFVAYPGETSWRTVMTMNDWAINYETSRFDFVNRAYNSFWPQNYSNDYAGAGSVAPPAEETLVEYTQIIFSKKAIPVPLV